MDAITQAVGSAGVVTAPAPAAVGAEFTPHGLDQYRAVVFLNTGTGVGAYTIPYGNLKDYSRTNYPSVAAQPDFETKFRPEIYAMGFRNPLRIQVDENDVAYIRAYSPTTRRSTSTAPTRTAWSTTRAGCVTAVRPSSPACV